jgi:hypothetical protein
MTSLTKRGGGITFDNTMDNGEIGKKSGNQLTEAQDVADILFYPGPGVPPAPAGYTAPSSGDVLIKAGDYAAKAEVIYESLIVPRHEIASFTNTAATQEVGATLDTWVYNWVYNWDTWTGPPTIPVAVKNPTSQAITPIAGGYTNPINSTLRTVTVTGAGLHPAAATTYNYTLSSTGTDGSTDTAITSIYFRLKRYRGVSANATLTDTQVKTLLTPEFTTGRAYNGSIDASVGDVYLYYCYPAEYGKISDDRIITAGLSTTWIYSLINPFVNQSGHTLSGGLIVYRSPNKLGGVVPIVVP